MSQAKDVLGRIEVARKYSSMFLADIPDDLWYRQPQEGVTNLIWQLGHIAIAQYRLALEQIRGKRSSDEELVPVSMFELYGRGSQPKVDPARNIPLSELRAIFDRIYQQVLIEVPMVSDADLAAEPVLGKHPMFVTKLQALEWCAGHELVHVGQIAILRRLFGMQPLR